MQRNARHHATDRQRRALVVEPQAADRHLGVAVLTDLDYRAEAVSSADEALARLGREPFALVLLSSALLDMAGPELVEKLRHLAEPTSLAIVILQPEGQASGRIRTDAGVIGHISRPITGASVRHLLEPAEATPRNGARPEPIVDMDHLLSFTDGDLELESELSVLFLSSAEAYFDKMNRSLQSGTPWTSSAHALKGASANLGARRLATLARSAEHQPPSAADLEMIRRAIDEVGAFFRERQHSHSRAPSH